MTTNQEIAGVFESIAGLLEIKGENVFKVRAYQRAARTIEHLSVELEQMLREERDLRQIPGIGEAIAEKIQELVTTGSLGYYERLKGELPDGILTLMEVPGVGPKTANRICTELGVSTVEGLERAILEGKVAALPRLGPKAAESILRHLRSLRTKDRRIPLGVALPVAEAVMAALGERCPGLNRLTPAGSLRRHQETVGDVDLMGTHPHPEEVIDALVHLPLVTDVLAHGAKKASVVVRDGLQIDLRIVPEEQFGSLIQYFTGSKQHNILLREYASRRGLSLSEYGITTVRRGELVKFAEEEAFYEYLDLQFIPPELRQGVEEVERAHRRALPTLVEVGDIRGDLHVHTDQSDGRDTLEAMVEAARQGGLQYIAITDHSAGRGIANGLSEERLRGHIRRIRELDAQLPDIKLLTGSEVDIRADGTLDYPDELLAELDVVVASVHSAMGQERGKMTRRVIRAMENPHVEIVGHLTCRLLGSRDPVEVDVEEVLQAALRTGTAMEVNASPQRLDLKDTHALRARELGVPLVISTDAHAVGNYDQMRFGVAVARRAWCQPEHVLNTRPLEGFLQGLKRG